MISVTSDNATRSSHSRGRVRRWIVVALVAMVLILVLRSVLDPYDERGIMTVPHGDHNHYVPQDRDPDVSISNFPVVYPGPGERIMPDGRIVPVSP
jgi:hypothetical protein